MKNKTIEFFDATKWTLKVRNYSFELGCNLDRLMTQPNV